MWCTARFYVKLRASIFTKIPIQFLGFLQSLWWYYQGNFEQSSWKQQSELCQNHGSFPNHQVQGNQRIAKSASKHQQTNCGIS